MDYIKALENFSNRLEESLSAGDAKSVRAVSDIVVRDMLSAIEGCGDELFYPAVYNAAATIRSAPEGCSLRQLTEAISDAAGEMRMIIEYMNGENG